jgi:hypothetical protein
MKTFILAILTITLGFAIPSYAGDDFELTVEKFDVSNGEKSSATSFDWKSSGELSITIDVALQGNFTQAQKLKVFVTLSEDSTVLYKGGDTYWVYPGKHDYTYSTGVSAGDFFGDHNVVARLEMNMIGFDTVIREIPLSLTGPGKPRVWIDRMEFIEGTDTKKDIYKAGEDFRIQADIDIRENDLAKPLRLVVAVEPYPVGNQLYAGEVFTEHALELSKEFDASNSDLLSVDIGVTLPNQFETPLPLHPFRVYLLVCYKNYILARAERMGTMFQLPKARDKSNRQTPGLTLDDASSWIITELD